MCTLINQQLPEFKVNAYRKDKGFFTVTNEDLKGKWSILFFYPGDFTFVCPTELADLQDFYAELQGLGVEVYSVSTDSHFVHKAWSDATDTIKGIEYTMLADMTFDLSRKVLEIHDNGIGRDASELMRKVKAAKFVYENPGLVCPAKWKEGAATLKPSIDLVGKI